MRKDALSPAQFRALESAVLHGSPNHHLKSQLDWGGWGVTREALQRRGYLDDIGRLTDAGRRAYERQKAYEDLAARQSRMI